MNKIKLSNQQEQVLNLLKDKGSVSSCEAVDVYKIRSVSSRISELKKKGYQIKNVLKKDLTGQRYMRYILLRKTPKVA